uniref:Lactate dehydrogenase n=1 Tax=Candidatus Kentrum sp. UNK TaxID=2126344 RepID=A0A451A7G9_9GAMM|nr:MAG: Lactate dehydrogenase [Candidatus Kentron sp. UNK]VFK70084.1 MAG: Lactate dehydrogenase [Candidatus Kentron sp. UNK]
MKKKCLILNNREPIPENHLEDLGDQIEVAWYQKTDERFSLLDAIDTDADSHIIITTYMDLNADYLRRMPQLEAIITTTVSTHFVDSGYCGEHGIKIFNTENYTGSSVAEHAVALMMSATRQIPAIDGQVRQGNTECFDYPGTELSGKTAGIIGLGNIGGYVAQLLSGFNMEIQYYNRSPKESALARAVSLETLLDTSDIVFLTTSLNNDSYQLIDEKALRRMKPSALLVNISPDDVMDKVAVKGALERGDIAGAAMDLLTPELFLDTPRTVLTVRRAWFTTECFTRRIGMWKGILRFYLAGEEIKTAHDLDFVPIEESTDRKQGSR